MSRPSCLASIELESNKLLEIHTTEDPGIQKIMIRSYDKDRMKDGKRAPVTHTYASFRLRQIDAIKTVQCLIEAYNLKVMLCDGARAKMDEITFKAFERLHVNNPR